MNIFRQAARRMLPAYLRGAAMTHLGRWVPALKHSSEMDFWKERASEAPSGDPDYYRNFMLRMGRIDSEEFFAGRICVDVGCGPRDTLGWMTSAKARIGIDPLAEEYMRFGITDNNMIYLSARVEKMPIPSDYADVVLTMNALDHVDNPRAACREIRRVLRPGGHFIGSLNLDEPRTITEPWTLTEDFLAKHLFKDWEAEHYELRPKMPDPNPYEFFHSGEERLDWNGPHALWCRFRVPDVQTTADGSIDDASGVRSRPSN